MTEWMRVLDARGWSEEQAAAAVVQAMPHVQVLRLCGLAAERPLESWRRIGEALGPSADEFEDSVTGELQASGGRWMDVRYEPDRPDTYRHHNVGQPLHCDGAYIPAERTARLALFYLERPAPAGGESLFVDAATVDAYARAEAPALHQRLHAMPVRFGKAGGADRIEPILGVQQGRLKINWNGFRVLPGQGEDVDRLREDFRALLERLVEDEAAASFRLEAAEAVFFRDDEVLHGRRAYAARESGDRLLWKTYFHLPIGYGPADAVRRAA